MRTRRTVGRLLEVDGHVMKTTATTASGERALHLVQKEKEQALTTMAIWTTTTALCRVGRERKKGAGGQQTLSQASAHFGLGPWRPVLSYLFWPG
ncbi:MAG: hypothetical protein ACJ8FY_16410 [Gemmataceae bacterium]